MVTRGICLRRDKYNPARCSSYVLALMFSQAKQVPTGGEGKGKGVIEKDAPSRDFHFFVGEKGHFYDSGGKG